VGFGVCFGVFCCFLGCSVGSFGFFLGLLVGLSQRIGGLVVIGFGGVCCLLSVSRRLLGRSKDLWEEGLWDVLRDPLILCM
jgi:hypothetical protein